MRGLTDIGGILVGHVSDYDGLTGCTAILMEGGAAAGVDIRGSATGTEEFELLSPTHLTERIHAIVFAGGSAFGLEAASGVRRFLEHKGVGFDTGAARVPLVPAAILYDLGIGKSSARPTREMGESAAANASDKPVAEGAVGAGTGATVGKTLGMQHAMKSGLGSYTVPLPNGVLVSALAAVNALGDVIDPANGAIVAGARKAPESRDFANSAQILKHRPPPGLQGKNTTLVAVATNARLTKVEAKKLAEFGSAGMARTISPVWTMFDGDLVVGLSVGALAADINSLGVAAAEAVSQAILRAVRLAPSLGGLPGLKS
ncbi:MAG TPA: P1 family peptidase [Bryobacteraceae bacterium]|nr:P1 family peptidase [Bryobacteraceae bacterium]